MEMNGNEWKWMEMNGNEWKWMEMNGNEWKWMELNGNEWNERQCMNENKQTKVTVSYECSQIIEGIKMNERRRNRRQINLK